MIFDGNRHFSRTELRTAMRGAMRGAAGFLALVLAGVGGAVATATDKLAPTPLNLDTYDAAKQRMALPNGETIAYISMGNPAGPPLVLIHGFTDNARDWVPLIPYLDPSYHLIIPDLRGHGKSDKPECCYARMDFAYDIKLLLDALKVPKADIVAHSMGSIIAQAFAEQWPARTKRLVLISSSGGQDPKVPHPAPQMDYVEQILHLKEPIDPDSKFMIEWWSSPTYVDPDFLRRQRRDAAAIPLAVWVAVLEQAFPDYVELQRDLPKLRAPTLLIWGSEDPIMEEDVRQTLRQGLPKAQVKIFNKLGHNPFWEEPSAVATTINQFLAAEH